ncbi:MAG: SDR family NAD(P)-dependent oxidoreductase, partial [Ruminococcus sp.]|nr:SDR family NAD(P)-dependent oxidoreductase [Ruminococcus sp.]
MKIALVTGGTGGIGQAICRKLSADGYYVLINYLNSKEKAKILAEKISGKAVKFDVSDINE